MNCCDALAVLPLSWAAWTDLKKRIIPNWTAAVILALGVLKVLLHYQSWQAAAAGLIPLAVAMRDQHGMGGGDVKLIAATLTLCGLILGVLLLLVSFAAAAAAAVITKQNKLPLAPFIWGAFLLLEALIIML